MSILERIHELLTWKSKTATKKKRKKKGNPQALRDWYNEDSKNQIRWGEEGDFMRCVKIASKYMSVEEAKGFCNLRHQDATGHPPGKGPHSKGG